MEYLLGSPFVTRCFERPDSSLGTSLPVGFEAYREEDGSGESSPRHIPPLAGSGAKAERGSNEAEGNSHLTARQRQTSSFTVKVPVGASGPAGAALDAGPSSPLCPDTVPAAAESLVRRATAAPPSGGGKGGSSSAAGTSSPLLLSARKGGGLDARCQQHQPDHLQVPFTPILGIASYGSGGGDPCNNSTTSHEAAQAYHPTQLEYRVSSRSLLGKYVLLYLPPPRTAADFEAEGDAHGGFSGSLPIASPGGGGAGSINSRARSPPMRDLGPHSPMMGFSAAGWGGSPAMFSPPLGGKPLSRSAGVPSFYGSPDTTFSGVPPADDTHNPLGGGGGHHGYSSSGGPSTRCSSPSKQRLIAFYCLLLQRLKHEADRQRERKRRHPQQHQAKPSPHHPGSGAGGNTCPSEGTTASSPRAAVSIRRHSRRNFVEAPVAVLEIHYGPPVPPSLAFPLENPGAGAGAAATAGGGGGAGAAASPPPSVGAAHLPGGPLSLSASHSASRGGTSAGAVAGAGATMSRYAGGGVPSGSVEDLSLTVRNTESQRQAHPLGGGGGAAAAAAYSTSPHPHQSAPSSLVTPIGSNAYVSMVLELLAEGTLDSAPLPESVVFDESVMSNPFYGGWMYLESSDAYRRVIQRCEVSQWPAVTLIDPAGNVLTGMGLAHIEAELDHYVQRVLRPYQRHQLHQQQLRQQELQHSADGSRTSSTEGYDLAMHMRAAKLSGSRAAAAVSSDPIQSSAAVSSHSDHGGSATAAAMTMAAAGGAAESGDSASPSPSQPREATEDREQRFSSSHSVLVVPVGTEEGSFAQSPLGQAATIGAATEGLLETSTPLTETDLTTTATITTESTSRQPSMRGPVREASSVSINDPQVPTAEPTPVKVAALQSPHCQSEGRSHGGPAAACYRDPAPVVHTLVSLNSSLTGEGYTSGHRSCDLSMRSTSAKSQHALHPHPHQHQHQHQQQTHEPSLFKAATASTASSSHHPRHEGHRPLPTGSPSTVPPKELPFTSFFPWNELVATAEILSAEFPQDTASPLLSSTALSASAQTTECSATAGEDKLHLLRTTTTTGGESELTLTTAIGNVLRTASPLAASAPATKTRPMWELVSLAVRVSDILDTVESASGIGLGSLNDEGRATCKHTEKNSDSSGSSSDGSSTGRRRRRQGGSGVKHHHGRRSQKKGTGAVEAKEGAPAFSPSPQRPDGAIPVEGESSEGNPDSENEPLSERDGDALGEAGMTWQQRAARNLGPTTTHLICLFAAEWHPGTDRAVRSLRRLADSIERRRRRRTARLSKRPPTETGDDGDGKKRKRVSALDEELNRKFTRLLSRSEGGADTGGCESGQSGLLGDVGGGGFPNDGARGGGLGGSEFAGGPEVGGAFAAARGFGGFANPNSSRSHSSSGGDGDDAGSEAGAGECANYSVQVIYISLDEDVASLVKVLRGMPADWLCLPSIRLPRALDGSHGNGRGDGGVAARQLVMERARAMHAVNALPRMVVLELPTAAVALRRSSLCEVGEATKPGTDPEEGDNNNDGHHRRRSDADAGVFDFADDAYEGFWYVPQDRAEAQLSADPTGKHFPWTQSEASDRRRPLFEFAPSHVSRKSKRHKAADAAMLARVDLTNGRGSRHRGSPQCTSDGGSSAVGEAMVDEDGFDGDLLSVVHPRFPPLRPFFAKDHDLAVLLEHGGHFVVLCAMGAVEASVHQQCVEALDEARVWLYEEIERRKEQLWSGFSSLHDNPPYEDDDELTTGNGSLTNVHCAVNSVPALQLSENLRASPSMGGGAARQASSRAASAGTSAAASPRPAGGGLCLPAMTGTDGALPRLPPVSGSQPHISLPNVYFYDAVYTTDGAAADTPQDSCTRASPGHDGKMARGPAPPPLQPVMDNTENILDNHKSDLGLLQEYIIAPVLEQGEKQLAVREGELFLACVRLPDRTTAILRRKLANELPPPTATANPNAHPGGSTTIAGPATLSGKAGAAAPPVALSFTKTAPKVSPPAALAPRTTEVPPTASPDEEEGEASMASPSGRVPTAAPVSTGGPGGFPAGGAGGNGSFSSQVTSLSNTLRTEPSPDPNASPVTSPDAVKRFLSENILSLLYL